MRPYAPLFVFSPARRDRANECDLIGGADSEGEIHRLHREALPDFLPSSMQQHIEMAVCDAEPSSDVLMRHFFKVAECEDRLHALRQPTKTPVQLAPELLHLQLAGGVHPQRLGRCRSCAGIQATRLIELMLLRLRQRPFAGRDPDMIDHFMPENSNQP